MKKLFLISTLLLSISLFAQDSTATDSTDGSKTANTSPSITVNPGAFVKLQLLAPGRRELFVANDREQKVWGRAEDSRAVVGNLLLLYFQMFSPACGKFDFEPVGRCGTLDRRRR